MTPDELEHLIESKLPDAEATVSLPRAPDPNHEDAHFAATVVSPAFEGKSLVEQHQQVYDAIDEKMTTEIHALELSTQVPD
ncbi:MAG: transcriptional regulator, BolA family protein [Haloquadratum sp. J07HQX50]|jgi:transcriptional regulator, BolA protein family|nr:MAG: transcriptional regulator, BolA family protein [Haloquadratum sp. J07HQX50]